MACPVKSGFGDTAAHVLEYRSRCVTIAGRSQRAIRLIVLRERRLDADKGKGRPDLGILCAREPVG
jgi:hypothetical protein